MKTIAILALALLLAGVSFSKAEYGDIEAEFGDVDELQDDTDLQEDLGELQQDSDDEEDDQADKVDSFDDNDPEGNIEKVGLSVSHVCNICSDCTV